MTTTAIGTIPDPTPLNVIQGATFTFLASFFEADGTTPRTLSAYRARMQVRTKQAIASPLVASLSSEAIDTDVVSFTMEPAGATGVLHCVIPATITALFSKKAYWYDLFIVDKTDPTVSERPLYGPVDVSNSVTAEQPA